MKVISACLAGVQCRYDGKGKPNPKIMELVKEGKAILVCPEQLGGLPTPRTPSEQKGDKVLTTGGKDITLEFVKGAEEALKIAEMAGCTKAILKAKSPSCGYGKVYDGSFTGTLKEGNGVFAELLKKKGFTIITEEDIV
jgi:uncharacterized protein YbbK (DUF523 family)